jgi:hypothetical protein
LKCPKFSEKALSRSNKKPEKYEEAEEPAHRFEGEIRVAANAINHLFPNQ